MLAAVVCYSSFNRIVNRTVLLVRFLRETTDRTWNQCGPFSKNSVVVSIGTKLMWLAVTPRVL